MKKFLKWLLLGLVITIAGFVVSMRYHDGPMEFISGGPFKSGELSPAPADWSFLKDRDSLQFQTLSPSRSRTVWLGVHQGRLFVVSGYMTTGYGKLWKHWPHYLEQDDRIILRIDGKLYEQRLQRIMTGPEIIPVLSEFVRKYGVDDQPSEAEISEGHSWMFEVVARD
ncbi:MAG: hypothetical protein COC19_06320 [SAR86 cluster bacterium]|uniref:Uncharacterized protein n=1 Tax=SAR86 cluster bacterium TaxID=2030880 RepID=A0A2A4MIS4_9GAMM|nr:MAG: hypothetical protein COC19_06320 [SAR86 cluster bacterium]